MLFFLFITINLLLLYCFIIKAVCMSVLLANWNHLRKNSYLNWDHFVKSILPSDCKLKCHCHNRVLMWFHLDAIFCLCIASFNYQSKNFHKLLSCLWLKFYFRWLFIEVCVFAYCVWVLVLHLCKILETYKTLIFESCTAYAAFRIFK